MGLWQGVSRNQLSTLRGVLASLPLLMGRMRLDSVVGDELGVDRGDLA